jgi:hypothetical protein
MAQEDDVLEGLKTMVGVLKRKNVTTTLGRRVPEGSIGEPGPGYGKQATWSWGTQNSRGHCALGRGPAWWGLCMRWGEGFQPVNQQG